MLSPDDAIIVVWSALRVVIRVKLPSNSLESAGSGGLRIQDHMARVIASGTSSEFPVELCLYPCTSEYAGTAAYLRDP